MKSDTAQPPEKSALDFGWEDQNGLSPVYFVGQTYLHLQFESTGGNMHQSLDIDIAHCRSDFVQHKHNPENTNICLYMYTANLSENLKKSDQQSKRVTIRFDLPNQNLMLPPVDSNCR
jgi:hypothetical protein